MELFNKELHGNRKLKLGRKKIRVSELKRMNEEELKALYEEILKDIEPNLDTLWFKYTENLRLKEQGLPYGTDLLINEEEENKTPVNGPKI